MSVSSYTIKEYFNNSCFPYGIKYLCKNIEECGIILDEAAVTNSTLTEKSKLALFQYLSSVGDEVYAVFNGGSGMSTVRKHDVVLTTYDHKSLLEESTHNNPYACLILAQEILRQNIKNDHDVIYWLNHAINLPEKYELLKQKIRVEYTQQFTNNFDGEYAPEFEKMFGGVGDGEQSESKGEQSEQEKGEQSEQEKGEQSEQEKGEQSEQEKGEQEKGEQSEQEKGEQSEPKGEYIYAPEFEKIHAEPVKKLTHKDYANILQKTYINLYNNKLLISG